MSDTYDRNGVKVTPLGGGFYELSHASLTDGPVKVRGKENADAEADKIAATGQSTGDDSHIEQQPASLDALAQTAQDAGKALEAERDKNAASDDKMSALQAQLADALRERDELVKAAAASADAVTTIRETEGERVEGRVPAGIPTAFRGEMSKEAKKALKDAGLGWTKIILEENSDIPPTGLFVGHNGKGYMIQPGEPCDVPDFVLGVLNDARMSSPVTDSRTMKVLGYRERSKYPYRLVD